MRLAKSAHLAFPPTGRLVAVLGAVVHACGRIDENVLYLSKLRDISPRRRAMSRRLRWNRKYQRTAQLMTIAGKRWP
jgi:hypothetical protein